MSTTLDEISERAKRKILGLNAARIYGLDSNVRRYNAVPPNYASLVPKQLKDLPRAHPSSRAAADAKLYNQLMSLEYLQPKGALGPGCSRLHGG